MIASLSPRLPLAPRLPAIKRDMFMASARNAWRALHSCPFHSHSLSCKVYSAFLVQNGVFTLQANHIISSN
jgi:hypothetical protein